MKTTIFIWIGRLMVTTLAFGISGLGLVNGQPHKSTSLGLVCQSAKYCDGVRCNLGKVERTFTRKVTEKRAKYKAVTVRCAECEGVDKNTLRLNPCPRCRNSLFMPKRVFDGYEYVPVTKKQNVFENCTKCKGWGNLQFGPRFQVADADFPKKMNWDDAVTACRSLGGWVETADRIRIVRNKCVYRKEG